MKKTIYILFAVFLLSRFEATTQSTGDTLQKKIQLVEKSLVGIIQIL